MDGTPKPAGDETLLRIVVTGDVHMHLTGHDYLRDRPAGGPGLAGAAPVVARLRDAVPGALLVDAGDFLQGTPLADLLSDCAGFGPEDAPHPAIEAMNALGYHAAALGNHDFNYGLPFLRRVAEQARFPLLSANIHAHDGGAGFCASRLVSRDLPGPAGRRHRLAVGLFGLTPPQVVRWDRAHLEGRATAEDMLAAARREVALLRAQGADVVVALAHTGIAAADPGPWAENAAVPLAALDGIDAIVAGHIHRPFPDPDFPAGPAVDPVRGTLHGRAAVMVGAEARYVGVIDLHLVRGRAGWRAAGHRSRALRVPTRGPPGPARRAVERAAAPAHLATRARLDHPVAETRLPIRSHFARVAPDAGLRIVADALLAWGARTLPAGLRAARPLLAAVAPFRAGGWGGPGNYIDIPAGPVRLRHLAQLFPFPNTACAVIATGADVRLWLERSAEAFRRMVPGASGQPLLDPEFAPYNFDVLHGLSYAFDIAAPPGARLRDLRHDGRPVAPGDEFVILTNSYRAAGGGGFAAAEACRDVTPRSDPVHAILRAHLHGAPPLAVTPAPVWRFAAPDRTTTMLFESGTGAARALAERPDRDRLGIAHQGGGGRGWSRFSLTLEAAGLAGEGPVRYLRSGEAGAGERLANPVRSGRKQP